MTCSKFSKVTFLIILFIFVQIPLVYSYGHNQGQGQLPQGSILPSGGAVQAANGPIEVQRDGSPVRARLEPPGDSATAPVDSDGLETPHAAELETPSTFFEDVDEGSATTTRSSATRAARVTHTGTSRTTQGTNVVNFVQEGDKITIGTSDEIQYGDITAEKVKGFQADGTGKLSIVEAYRIELPDGILGTVRLFSGHELKFHVGSAQDVYIGCIAMRQFRDSDFTINDQNIIIEPAKGVEFDIADCGFAQNHFKASSSNSTNQSINRHMAA